MPVNVEYQVFSSLNYDWKSLATEQAAFQIDSKLKAWVAACNANPGNSSKQITVHRDPASSTGTRTGWTIRFADGVLPGFMFHFASQITSGSSISGARAELFDTSQWTDNTSNSGYGGIGTIISSDTGIGWCISGAAAEFIVAQSSDPGQEFFVLSWNMANSTAYRDVFAFFKDKNDNWACEWDDGGVRYGIAQNPQKGLQRISLIQAAPITSPFHLSKLCFVSDGIYSGGEDASERLVYPAHPKLWFASTTNFGFGSYYAGNGREFIGLSYFDWVVEIS